MEKLEKKIDMEYDVYLKINKEDVHLITYLLEAEDHVMSVRNRVENGYIKIIVPGGLVDEALTLINSLKEQVELEVVKIEPHNGIV